MGNSESTKLPNFTDITAQKWNSIAESWHSWIPRMREWYAPATDLMLDLARIQPGNRVLDIAAGDCDQSMEIADRVGPNGYVLAIDVAEKLLEIGARFAREAGFQNIETRVMDASNLDLPDNSFDAVICRFALMYLPDAVSGLGGMNRVLRPDGRVSLVVYGVDGSPEFSLALAVVRKHLGLPEVKAAAHSLGEIEVLQQSLEKAGFLEIETHALDLPIHMASAEECIQYLQATSPTLKELISPLSNSEQKKVWDQVQQALHIYESPQGLTFNHKVIVTAGSPT
jgi:ubiquinone/menaquinone biosynthesis C-methylase UbiE